MARTRSLHIAFVQGTQQQPQITAAAAAAQQKHYKENTKYTSPQHQHKEQVHQQKPNQQDKQDQLQNTYGDSGDYDSDDDSG